MAKTADGHELSPGDTVWGWDPEDKVWREYTVGDIDGGKIIYPYPDKHGYIGYLARVTYKVKPDDPGPPPHYTEVTG